MADTIYALATGSVPSAIAVIRISGSQVGLVRDRFIDRTLKSNVLRRVRIRFHSDNSVLDHGMAVWAPGPGSYTGEDYLELHVHGSRAVVTAVLSELSRIENCRLAEPGEFSRRAFLNGKIDLASLEGLSDLIIARTEAQRRQSIAIASGFLTRRVEMWRDRLLEALALVETDIDFSDEGDRPSDAVDRILALVEELGKEFRSAIADAGRAETIRNGFVVAIVGAPNVGKSSLLNRLASREVAIVTEYPGTTRDTIEVELDLDGQSVILVDTAGIRSAFDPVEQIGIARAKAAADAADLVLLLDDRAQDVPFFGGLCRPQRVRTKVDLGGCVVDEGEIGISSTTGDGLDELLELIRVRAKAATGGTEPPLVTRERHRHAILVALEAVDRINCQLPVELMAQDLRTATLALESIVGIVSAEEVLGGIFSRFCIGK